jgi:hypothetical protein
VPFGGQNDARAGIGSGFLGAEVGPSLQIVDCVNDAAADLSVFRTCSVRAVLFERSS